MQRIRGERTAVGGLFLCVIVALSLGGCSDGNATAEAEGGEGGEEVLIPAVVTLDSVARAAAQLEMVTVERRESNTLLVTGVVDYDQNQVSHVGPRAEGRVVQVVTDLGTHVRPREPLAVLESPELGEVRGEHDRARAELEVARENYDREQRLYAEEISSRKEMLEAKASYESAAASLRASEVRLRTLGAVADGDGAEFVVTSPLGGEVVDRNLVRGQIVGPEDRLFTVADLTRLWLIVDVYEKDLGRVQEGQSVEVRTQAFPGVVFAGRVDHVGRLVDPATRTLKVRVVVQNRSHDLRPGMFAQAAIEVQEPVPLAVVPELAVQDVAGRTVVFVPEDGGRRFRMVDVQLGPKVPDGRVALLGGIEPGGMVVGRGAFYLKSELLKATFADDEG